MLSSEIGTHEILDEIEDGVYVLGRTERIEFWNRGAEAITGFSRDEVIGRTCADNLLCHVDSSGRFLCTTGCPLGRAFLTGQPVEADIKLQHKDGHAVPVHIKSKPLRDSNGLVVGAVELFRRTSLELLDDLTRLPNSRHFHLQLDKRLAELDRFGWPFGVLAINIDHFRHVNDNFGRRVGDEVLCLVASTLSANCRMLDTVARSGGDKFVALIANINGEDLGKLAEKLRFVIEMNGLHQHACERLRTTISIGAVVAQSGESAAELLRRADDLLRAAKTAGRNRVRC